MGMATHLGPWLLGTVKNTTGSTVGTIRNVGATLVSQSKAIAYADTTAQTTLAVIPAGSAIRAIELLITTAYTTTNPTFTFFVNGTAITAAVVVASPAAGATGVAVIALGSTNPALIGNVGATDAVLSFTQSNGAGGTGAIVATVDYIVRNADGTYAPTSFTGP
jgi:hypothetical protein